ncbi:hypothetical protein TNCV_4008001 [Trichonephila clavipes]|nr:hypothetical protein TNCV_4008001 [Trichonephila clavipes]
MIDPSYPDAIIDEAWNDMTGTNSFPDDVVPQDDRRTPGVKNGRSLQGKLTDGTVVVIEAGASFYTDPSSDRTINVKFVYYRIPKQCRLVSFRSAGLNNFLAEAY